MRTPPWVYPSPQLWTGLALCRCNVTGAHGRGPHGDCHAHFTDEEMEDERNELLEVIGVDLEPGFLGAFHITHTPFSNMTRKTSDIQGPLGRHQCIKVKGLDSRTRLPGVETQFYC